MTMRIVDAHHHLWDLEACRYPWLMARGVKRFFGDPTPIQKNYLVGDLRQDAAGYELLGSVHVQVGVAVGEELVETAWLETTAERDGLPSAIVAFSDLADASAAEALAGQQAYSRVRGIRQIVGRSEAEDAATGSGALLHSPAWYEGLALLREQGLSFDLQLIPPQLPAAADLFSRLPGLSVALCHCGSPWDQTPAGIKTWRQGLRLFAQLPDVSCKLSGFGMFDNNWTSDSIRPLVESCIEIFGVERCMFGSNFPVDKLHGSYSRLWCAYDEITRGLKEAERRALFIDNATRFYRL